MFLFREIDIKLCQSYTKTYIYMRFGIRIIFLNSPFKWNNFLSLNFSFCSSRISFQNLVFLDLETQDDLVWRVQTSLPGREESGDIEMFAWHFNSWRWSIPGSKANPCDLVIERFKFMFYNLNPVGLVQDFLLT